nr:MAG TPA: hypothetical protein [Caudoviricetes sp.]
MKQNNMMGGGLLYNFSRKEGKTYLIALLITLPKGGVCV